MLELTLAADLERPMRLLCLGAHSDDIEIGCGGSLLRLLVEHPHTRVDWVVFSADDQREAEARSSAGSFLASAGEASVTVHRFRESYFPSVGGEIKDAFEDLKGTVSPDLIFTHRRNDDHQDHRVISELTWNTFRNHLILEYEIPKFEGDLGQPNWYVPLEKADADRKVELLMAHFGTQRSKTWFRPEVFRGLMALRSIECGAASGWAEGFHARKVVI